MQNIDNRVRWIVAGVGVVLIIGRLIYANIDPPLEKAPPQVLPSPNALDTYREVFLYLPSKVQLNSYTGSRRLSMEQRKAELANAAEGLRLARVALTQQLVFPRPRSFRSKSEWQESASFRLLARVFVDEGEIRQASGDEKGAMNSFLDAMALGQQLQNGGNVRNRIDGFACQLEGRQKIWSLLDSWQTGTAKAAVRRLETINANYIPLSVNYNYEKIVGVPKIRWMLNDAKALREELGLEQGMESLGEYLSSGRVKPNPQPGDLHLFVSQQLFLLNFPKRKVTDDYKKYIDAMIAQADLPSTKRSQSPMPPKALTALTLVSLFQEAMYQDDTYRAANTLLTIALALHACKAEHKAYPETLNQLCPEYLTTLPADPYSAAGKTPPRYRRTGNKYLLYSIGPDGKDDNGTAISNGLTTGGSGQQAMLTPYDKGDIVVGKNQY